MLNTKFIVDTDKIVMAKVNYHRDLVRSKDSVNGGGWWFISANTLYLYSSSDEFGQFNMQQVQELVKERKVFTGRNNVFDKMTNIDNVVISTASLLIAINEHNSVTVKL